MAAPLLTWWSWPLIFAAMTIGYFGEAMSARDARETALMSAWGVTVGLISTISPWGALGALAGPIYWANHKIGNGRFDWTQRAEFFTGVSLGAALYLAA